MSCGLEVANESARFCGQNSCYITVVIVLCSRLWCQIRCLSTRGTASVQRWKSQQSAVLWWRGLVFKPEWRRCVPSCEEKQRDNHSVCVQLKFRKQWSWEASIYFWKRLYILYCMAHFTGLWKTGTYVSAPSFKQKFSLLGATHVL